MGLKRSIARRWILSRDFHPRDRLNVFFGSKEYRTELWDRKMGTRKKSLHARAQAVNGKVEAGARPTDGHVDPDWYAEKHGLEHPMAACAHFSEKGLALGLAPAPSFANSQGRLPQWGQEYFARLGVPVGQRSSRELLPSDPEVLRPFFLTNKERKPLAVVSANFGDFDRLLPLDCEWSDHADFFMISDRKFENPGTWKLVHANYFHVDPRRRARFVKTHLPSYFSAYERVMWLDGNVLLCRNPVKILRDYDVWESDFATFRHWQRSSLVSEAAACVGLGKDDPRIVGDHLAMIAVHPAFATRNLFWTMVMVMNPNSDAARRMSAHWWAYIMRGSKRDQLSLPLAIHDAAGLNWRVFPEERIEMSPNFVRVKH